MYIKRHAEKTISELAEMFGAILVAGPRQVGKTTLMERKTQGFRYASMDDSILLNSARTESSTFFKDFPPPVFIDEIQKAPELFPQMKLLLDMDKAHKKGQFFICGSQQLRMMKNVSESLSGRIGITYLLPLSLREISDIEYDKPFIPTEDYLYARSLNRKTVDYYDIWNLIQRGTLPELTVNHGYDWQKYYAAYVTTYLERDVRELAEVGDLLKFARFMTVCAASIGQLLNLSSIARDVGVSQPTAEKWLSVLIASNLAILLPPYSSNLINRSVKTPKLYFLDTGLAAYLLRWNNPEVLKSGAMAGAFFEDYVISEIVKSYYNRGIINLPLYFYRDKENNEIDLIIEENGILHPIEIKKHSDPRKDDIKAFRFIDRITDKKRGTGGVICTYDKLVSLAETDKVIPVDLL